MKEGWNLRKVRDVVKNTSNIKWNDNISTYSYIDLSSVSRDTLQIESISKINSETAPSRAKKIVKEGDIIFATTRPTLRRVTQIRTEFDNQICSTGFCVLRPQKDELISRYLFYFIRSEGFINRMGSLERGASYPAVSDSDVKNSLIPIPPLPEQKAIVRILDRAFAAIDQAQANLEKNIANAEELFQSKLEEIFSQRGGGSAIGEDIWEEKSLEELSFIKSGGTPSRSKSEYWNKGSIPWYSSGELNNLFTADPERFITTEGLNNSNARLFPKGSLLIGIYDTAALKMSIADRDATFNQAIVGIEPRDNIDLEFILHAINYQKAELLQLRRGVRQKNLSLKKIKNIKIYLPQLSTQERVVSDLRKIRSKVDLLKQLLQSKLNYLEDLKKSLLQKAFTGELSEKSAEQLLSNAKS